MDWRSVLQPEEMMGYIQRATIEDAAYIAKNLRDADRQECDAAIALPPELVLPEAVRAGRAVWTCHTNEGEPFIMFGVDPSALPSCGVVWMCSTPSILKHKVEFMRACGPLLDAIQDDFPVIHNVVDARNTLHIRWLKRCGFKFFRTLPRWGARSVPFIEFARIKLTCA